RRIGEAVGTMRAQPAHRLLLTIGRRQDGADGVVALQHTLLDERVRALGDARRERQRLLLALAGDDRAHRLEAAAEVLVHLLEDANALVLRRAHRLDVTGE